jgi:poly(A) polymerase
MKITSIQIIKTLHKKGYQALWAGGCVRDMLLGKVPKDFDIVTDAPPEDVESIFDKTIPIGKQFGIIMVQQDGHEFEIATFRKESDYTDGRRPSTVEFTDAYEDAHRRDFTINGMFYDPLTDKIIDHVNGQRDLTLGLVEFIGDANQRIKEDNLRLLRAVRFKNTLQFQYEPKTYKAVLEHAELVKNVSAERIQVELNKMIKCPRRIDALNDLEDLGLLRVILPEIQDLKGVGQSKTTHAEGDVYNHTLKSLNQIDDNEKLSIIWAVFLHDVGKATTFKATNDRITFNGHAKESGNLAKQILGRLKFSTRFIDHVVWLVERHMSLFQIFDMPKATQIKWFLHPWFLDLLELHKYDTMGQSPVDLTKHDQLLKLYQDTVSEIPSLPDPFLSGTEICHLLAIQPGPKVGKIKEQIYDLQLENKLKSKQEAQDYLLKHFT